MVFKTQNTSFSEGIVGKILSCFTGILKGFHGIPRFLRGFMSTSTVYTVFRQMISYSQLLIGYL